MATSKAALAISTTGLRKTNYTCQGVAKVLSFGHSSTYLGVLVVFAVGLAALVFRRRDIS